MNTPLETHPVQQAFGFVNLIQQRASSQLLFRQLAQWGTEQIAECNGLFTAIADGAADGREIIQSVAEDGIITSEEISQIDALLAKIEANALEGRS